MYINRNAITLKLSKLYSSTPLSLYSLSFPRHVWACQFLLGTFPTATLMQASTVYIFGLPITTNDFFK